MPKLAPKRAAEVKKAGEVGNKFSLLEEGRYLARLIDVESGTSKPKPPATEGKPMWTWKFETIQFLDGASDGSHEGKELRYWTVIVDEQLWDLDKMFAAFDAEPDTDTDDLINDKVVLMVIQEVIRGGKRAGQMGNTISEVLPLKDASKVSEFETVPAGSGKAEDDEPPF